MPGTVVLFLAFISAARNGYLAKNKRRYEFFAGSSEFLGGGEEIVEENDFMDAGINIANAGADFSLAAVKQPLLAAIEEVVESGSLDFFQSSDAVIANPLKPSYESDDSHREGISKYIVKEGDTATSIASYFGVSVNTVLWANGLHSETVIKPGNVLDILPITGVKHIVKKGETVKIIAEKYKASGEEIAFFNGIAEDGALETSAVIIIPGGAMPDIPKNKKEPGLKNIATGSPLKQLNGYFIYPAAGHNFGRIHANNGVDISNPKGGPIYAAAGGTVILSDSSGYNGGYGKYVKIQHPNGAVTLYAHLSKIYVQLGRQVNQGAIIGMMGNTGRSTGTHLHFEVRGAKNPLARY